jgi:hypothetical protein
MHKYPKHKSLVAQMRARGPRGVRCCGVDLMAAERCCENIARVTKRSSKGLFQYGGILEILSAPGTLLCLPILDLVVSTV